MTDSCDMGIKSILNISIIPHGEQGSRGMARSIGELEERLGKDMRPFL